MFGKKDEYDELYNSQEYVDSSDYIRPSEEYRADCGTEHGMTYENHNNEQHTYDNHNNAEAEFTSMLMLDEHILWAAQSNKKIGLAGGGTSAPVLFFAFIWLGFAIFWTVGASIAGGVFGLFGLPFVAVGIYLIVQSLNVGKKFYAITNKRVLRKERGHLTAHSLMDIHDVQMMKTSGNNGYITFASSSSGSRYRVNGRYVDMPVSLVGIENPEEAYRILNEAMYMASSTS